MARGGRRVGTPGKNYSNRSDLHGQAPKAAPGGEYGSVKASIDAQKVIPLPTANQPPVQQGEQQQQFQPPQMMAPGEMPFDAPTARPNEPVTNGLPIGPGAGPEALGMVDPTQADVQTWHSYLPTLEYLASRPDSTASTRNFVRRLRATMPAPEAMQ